MLWFAFVPLEALLSVLSGSTTAIAISGLSEGAKATALLAVTIT